uniref:Acyltransferase n=1 Tax=Heterorhabditis bacteriophora TaxID=37862 RepID=A0A1I7XJ86_HETBA
MFLHYYRFLGMDLTPIFLFCKRHLETLAVIHFVFIWILLPIIALWSWYKNSSIWRHFADYFPLRLVKTADLPVDRNYIIGLAYKLKSSGKEGQTLYSSLSRFVDDAKIHRKGIMRIRYGRSDTSCSTFILILARTSGVLLVAGVGSYCAYRICTKFLGRRFVWMLLDNSKYNAIPTADRRLLYSSGLSFSSQIDVNGEDEEDYRKDNKFPVLVSGSGTSEISVVHLPRYSRSGRTRGLYAIRQNNKNRDGVLSRQWGIPDRNSHSRNISPSSSNRSASIRIIWEGQQDWEDEFENHSIRGMKETKAEHPIIYLTKMVEAKLIILQFHI